MSWSLSLTTEGGFIKDIDTKQKEIENIKNGSAAHSDQVEQALDIARDIIESEVVGKVGKKFNISISGHGNPNHEPAAGWANDYLTISVYQQ